VKLSGISSIFNVTTTLTTTWIFAKEFYLLICWTYSFCWPGLNKLRGQIYYRTANQSSKYVLILLGIYSMKIKWKP